MLRQADCGPQHRWHRLLGHGRTRRRGGLGAELGFGPFGWGGRLQGLLRFSTASCAALAATAVTAALTAIPAALPAVNAAATAIAAIAAAAAAAALATALPALAAAATRLAVRLQLE